MELVSLVTVLTLKFTEMILPREIPQLDIPDVGKNHILQFFLDPVRKIIQLVCHNEWSRGAGRGKG